MKNEMDPRNFRGNQLSLDELTSNSNSSTLEREGEIFMPEPGGGETPMNNEGQSPREKIVSEEAKRASREAWERIRPWESLSVDERRTTLELIEMGVLPISGAEDTPPEEESENPRESEINGAENEGVQDITAEARSLLDKIGSGGVPFAMTSNLERILLENGVDKETIKESNLSELMEILRKKRDQFDNSSQAEAIEEKDDVKSSSPDEENDDNNEDDETPDDNPDDEDGGENDDHDDEDDPEYQELKRQNDEMAREATSTTEDIVRATRKSGTGTSEDQPEAEEGIKTFQQNYRESMDVIDSATSYTNEVDTEVDNLIFFAKALETTGAISKDAYERDYEPIVKRLERLRKDRDLNGIKSEVFGGKPPFSQRVISHYYSLEGALPDIPASLEDLCALIMNSENEEWKTGGENELLSREGKVNKAHFMAWVRKRMIEIHEFSPNSTVDFFSQITVKSRWSQISLQEMVLTGSYFTEKRNVKKIVPNIDKHGNIDKKKPMIAQSEATYHKNKDYEKLRQQLLTEAFLFNTSRNNHVEYVNIQFDEHKLLETISKIYGTNVFTRSNFMEFILSMPSMRDADKVPGLELHQGEEIKDRVDKNSDVGQAVRKALMAYYYIYDYDSLQKIFPDSSLFSEKYTGWDEDEEVEKTFTGVKGPGRHYDSSKWFRDGKLILDENGNPPKDFMEYINVFTGPGPNKDEAVITQVRERMVRAIMEQTGLDRREAQYAENWAFSMTKWTGLAAKNDTGAVGFDAWTKIINSQEYRIRQMADKRNASYGNIFNVLGLKRLGLNFFEGVRDTEGRTLLEAIQGGEGNDLSNLNTSIRDLYGKDRGIRFQQHIMGNFASNHVASGFHLHEFLVDHNQLNFQDFLTFEPGTGRAIIDYEKANKMVDGVEKAVRYWLSTWGGTDYGKTIRTWEKHAGSDGKTVDDAIDLPIVANLFGAEILRKIKDRYEEKDSKTLFEPPASYQPKIWRIEGTRDPRTGKELSPGFDIDVARIQESDIRELLWKDAFAYIVEAEIESHRNVTSDQPRFNMVQMEAIWDFLRTKHYYSEQEIQKMRRETHTTTYGLFLQSSGGAVGGGLAEALKALLGNIGQIYKVS